MIVALRITAAFVVFVASVGLIPGWLALIAAMDRRWRWRHWKLGLSAWVDLSTGCLALAAMLAGWMLALTVALWASPMSS